MESGSSYYMCSSSMTTYNKNGTTIKCKKKVRVNDNGKMDKYYKESIIENDRETIVKEDGNKDLENKQVFPNIWERWDKLMAPLWNWPDFGWRKFPFELENRENENDKKENNEKEERDDQLVDKNMPTLKTTKENSEEKNDTLK